MVYSKDSKLYLAVSESAVLTRFHPGTLQIVRPRKPRRFSPETHISVNELCLRWKLDVEVVDRLWRENNEGYALLERDRRIVSSKSEIDPNVRQRGVRSFRVA